MIDTEPASPTIALATAAPARPLAVAPGRRSDLLLPLRGAAQRLSETWLPLLAWHVSRTGRSGLVGIGLLVASAMFFFTTHLPVAREAEALRADLTTALARGAAAPTVASESARALRHLPGRADMPALLGVLLQQADAAKLTLDTAKYESSTAKAGAITRYKVSFPVSGPYPQIRQFVDSTLIALPTVSINELSLERKAIGDQNVEARIRLTFYTRGAP